MKKTKFIYAIAFTMFIAAGCSKDGLNDDLSFVDTPKSTDNANTIQVSDDNSGVVVVNPTGGGASYFVIDYGHNGAIDTVLAGRAGSHIYPEGTFNGTVTALDLNKRAGASSTFQFTMLYRAPENVDFAIANNIEITPKADFASSFLVYYGDVANEVGTPVAAGGSLPAHHYAGGGPYYIHVVAISGNPTYSGAATTTSDTKQVWGLPIEFEDATVDYFFGTFGNVTFSKVANPAPGGLNSSASVGQYGKPIGAETWSGTYTPLSIPIDFAFGNKIKVLLYNPDPANIGKLLNVELEAGIGSSGAPANGVAILKQPITTSGAWEELTFDFSSIPAIPATSQFKQLVLRFNDSQMGANETIYLDNFRLTN